jgi:hypothetical protein
VVVTTTTHLTKKEKRMKLNRLTRKTTIFLAALVLALFGVGAALAAAGYSLFGDAMLVSPGNNSPTAAQIRYDPAGPGFGGVDFTIPAGLTVADLNNLSTDYKFVVGSCRDGSPRFQVNVTNGTVSGNIFIYIGSPPSYTGCPQNIWLNTGNLATPISVVDTSQLPLGTFYDVYGAAQTKYGSYQVTGIQLVADGFSGITQTTHVDNVMINDQTITFEKPVPTNTGQCKNGGWMTFGRADGSGFKNQGDCIQYVNTGK